MESCRYYGTYWCGICLECVHSEQKPGGANPYLDLWDEFPEEEVSDEEEDDDDWGIEDPAN